MKKEHKEMVERYQCPGCVSGNDISCFQAGEGIGCAAHVAGTLLFPNAGRIFLGMPTGFCRTGKYHEMKLIIFKRFEDCWAYDMYNVPVWKHLDKYWNTLVRGISPRINRPWLHVFMGDQIDKINCLEIIQIEMDSMD